MDEWKKRNVGTNREYAILTAERFGDEEWEKSINATELCVTHRKEKIKVTVQKS
ncbi:MAG: hypothetical protein HZA34_03745 [Candidatus Pacebacteria bacterium]|nr:hypothetical protein [Candidatus Paceibacterota bacterium]